jgi:hypothetical protein
MSVKVISERLSIKSLPSGVQAIVLGRIERWKESLLAAWLLAWLLIGGVVLREYWLSDSRDMRMILFVFLVFWAYYLWRVGRVWLYRRGGNELIRIAEGTLTLKRSFFTYGKAHSYDVEAICNFKRIELNPRSLAYTYENGWWVLGGERFGFEYHGRFVKFGMQLTDAESAALYNALRQAMKGGSRK